MTSENLAFQQAQHLIEQHTRKSGTAVEITHPLFETLPKETRQLIMKVIKAIYLKDFEILRKAFAVKLELFARLILSTLESGECNDKPLLDEINTVREAIAKTVNEALVTEDDHQWLKNIGFEPIDIFELAAKVDMPGLIGELKPHIDTYMVIFKDLKYLIKMLKFSQGLKKLQAVRPFSLKAIAVNFNGSQLCKIVRGSGWEEKLKYFEDDTKLNKLKEAGFNGSHLAQIVVGAEWEEKLKYFEDDQKLNKLKEAGFNGSHLAQIVTNAGWEEKLKYFEDDQKLNKLKEAGFNGYHLAQIVTN
ncbi:MAG: hypothetical protein Q8O95_00460, partial [bacterium]|nr:hypothetical protein [bacterium]